MGELSPFVERGRLFDETPRPRDPLDPGSKIENEYICDHQNRMDLSQLI